MPIPILYSFRRCPYAMRARLAISSSGMPVELREVVLRDKPVEMVEASPKATVPVLILEDGAVIEESIEIMHWALEMRDPEGMRDHAPDILMQMDALIARNDGEFKTALDRYKYPNRYEGVDRDEQRGLGAEFIQTLDAMLEGQLFLFDSQASHADLAILPFIRQFAHVDRDWFWEQDFANVIRWLDAFLESERFQFIMTKFEPWKSGEVGVRFGV